MSATLIPASEPQEGDASQSSTTLGGNKPLYRFMKGQPKFTGISVLIIGSSLFILTIAAADRESLFACWLGILFMVCGMLYIVTAHNPTKKTVTISLALSIIAFLGSIWAAFVDIGSLLVAVPRFSHPHDLNMTDHDEHDYDFDIDQRYEHMFLFLALEAVITVNILAAAVIFLVMTVLAGSALRSSKSQLVVVTPTTEMK